MAYSESAILYTIQTNKNTQRQHFQQGIIKIAGVSYIFAERTIMDSKFSMVFPQEFLLMSPGDAQEKYPSKDRPQIIYSSKNGSINLTFSLTPHIVYAHQIEDCLQGFQLVLKRVYKANTFFNLSCEPLGTTTLGFFDYRSYALDADLYNVLFTTCIDGSLLVGTFSCLYRDHQQWASMVHQMMRSIVDLTEEGI